MQPSTWNDERITAYALGELSASEVAQIEADMQANADLATAVDEAKIVTKQLTEMFAAESPMSLDAMKRNAILEAPAARLKPPVVLPGTASHSAARRYFALAASVLLLGTVATVFYRMDAVDRGRAPQVAMSSSPMSEVDVNAAPVTKGAVPSDETAKEGLSRGFDLDTSERVSMEVLAEDSLDNGRGVRMAIGGESTRLKQKTMPVQEPANALSNKELDDDAMVSPNSSSMVAPMPSAMSADKSDESSLGHRELAKAELFRHRAPRRLSLDVLSDDTESSVVASELAKDGRIAMGDALGVSAPGSASADSIPGESVMLDKSMKMGDFFGSEFQGQGPGLGGDRFERIAENNFKRTNEEPLSTFSIDVDTASYSKVRQIIMQSGTLPPAGAVRIEELVNYFDYGYEPPAAGDEHPFASRVEVAACPWKPEHRLARIAIKGKVIENAARPMSNLVFLVDTSGSMEEPNKLPLVKQGLQKLVSRLGERDRVAIAVYAGSAGLVLDSTPANDQSTILRKINQMQSGGSTNGGQGIRLAYQVARDHFIKDGVNRVILCSDGDFNVGTTSDDELVGLIETESKGGIDLTVLGFGMGNHNDSMMEKVSGRGNGNYAFIDSASEANRVLVEQTSGTLVTIARDVKIQVEFNPAEVAAYRLIGYENRNLANEDFKDDTKDAGEIGAGHTVTALYELIPASGDVAALAPAIDELRYQKEATLLEPSKSGELMTVKLRYKKPDSDTSIPVSFPATDGKHAFADATEDFRFAAAVAGFGMLLRSSEHVGSWTMSDVQKIAEGSKGNDPHGLRTEFVEIVSRAGQLVVKE